MLQLRSFQAETLSLLKSKKIHVALTAATGAGKGLILERLAENPSERVLLISPLIALGRQQRKRFEDNQVSCLLSLGEKKIAPTTVMNSSRVWILSPESLLNDSLFSSIRNWKPTLVAVDEAHCIEEWGQNFRPAFMQLTHFIQTLNCERTLWMSATFPRKTLFFLKEKIKGNWDTVGEFSIPKLLTLKINQVHYSSRVQTVRNGVLEKDGSGILFGGTRSGVENYTQLFSKMNKTVYRYHAGMSDEERRITENNLSVAALNKTKSHIVIATNAFGMGMHYPHLEWVLVAKTPFSLIELMQSVGRVARGTQRGVAEVFWTEEDMRIAGFQSQEPNKIDTLREFLTSNPLDRLAILRKNLL